MSDDQGQPCSEADAALQREILEGRKFTLEEAVARMVGPGAMKGESPVARMRQAEVEIESWLGANLLDSGGALRGVLARQIKRSDLLLTNYERPLVVIADCCQRLLASDYLLQELVREADVDWARTMGERPYLDRDGSPSHPDDPYTVASIRTTLSGLIALLAPADE
jgi:hypothetical protein